MFIEEHLAILKKAYPDPPTLPSHDDIEGRSPQSWFTEVKASNSGIYAEALPKSVNRRTLLQMAEDKTATLELCISILAWGGMRTSHGHMLLSLDPTPWLDIANQVRNGTLNRSNGYDAFIGLRQGKGEIKNKIPGMGPAYFTKLLYFLAPTGKKGYIMDQWLGCSVNLLTAQTLVKLNESIMWFRAKTGVIQQIDSVVSDVNSGKDYENFCNAIESLSAELGDGWTPEITERALISDGGRNRHDWRDYVIRMRHSRLVG